MLFKHSLILYRKNKLSLGKAAELAGYDRLTFIQKLQLENEPIYDYEPELIAEMANNNAIRCASFLSTSSKCFIS